MILYSRYNIALYLSRVSLKKSLRSLIQFILGAVSLIGKASVLKTDSNRVNGVRVRVSSASPSASI